MKFAPLLRRHVFIALAGCLLLAGGQLPSARAEAMLQLFNVSWSEVARKMPELAEAGYNSLWLPPPAKASGGLSVGYDLWDPFDLGSEDQRNTVRTRYGTEAELLHMMEVAHRFGIRVYFDNIMNHRAFDVPGFNENTPIGGEGQTELYPGMVPEDFHLRKTEDGFYRKWDNTRDWGDAWQVQNLGLSDLIDIAHETPNANFGPSEGSTHPKYSFVRDLERPGQYDKDKDGNTSYFGVLIDQARSELGADASAEEVRLKARGYILSNRQAFVEDVGAYLIRAVRWKMDRTKADGLRLDAVKHVPDYFFGWQGAGKDTNSAGYLGGVQWQFNRTRGFSDANHRDSVFEDKVPRDDALVFGEHLGQPPGYGGYWDAGMRLVDNDLRSKLNGTLGNPGAGLQGLDAPGAGGFPQGLGVTHANSHDSDFAAQKEWQHAFYMTREGMGLIYSDGYNKAETLGESGGAFPRHANTAYLGQFGDPRIPNILKIHNDFARGLQDGRWADGDFVAFERRDNRNPDGSTRSGNAGDEITMVVMMNDNTAQGQSRAFSHSFGNGAYLHQYARGPGSMTGFDRTNLSTVTVPPGGYFVFSWRTPELSTLWPDAAVTLYQANAASGQLEEVPRISVTRQDGRDGDASFNPDGLDNRGYPDGATPVPYTYQTTVPVVKGGSPLTILARADGSAENILVKLDGGVNLNTSRLGTDPAWRDNPPGLRTDTWLGYEQPLFVDRQHPEKFAAKDTTRCKIGSARDAAGQREAETYVKVIGGAVSINNGPTGANNYDAENGNQASWVYHDPADNVGGIADPPQQLDDAGAAIIIWAKSNSVGGGFKAFVYYTLDGSSPEGAGGIGRGTTRVAELNYRHSQTGDDWWGSASIPKPAAGTVLAYKIGFFKNEGAGAPSWWPASESAVTYKKKMLTTFRVADFDPAAVQHFPHNDYARVPTPGQPYGSWPFALQTGLSEGFHVLRARAFLNRGSNQAPLYNTFVQTFYYDAKTPDGDLAFPAANGATVGGSGYEMVVRTDMTVEEVWYSIADSENDNDDAVTRRQNGNGAGFEPFVDANNNGLRDANETFTDLNGNGGYDVTLNPTWARATEVTPSPSINSLHQKEWRFTYNNIPVSGAATIKVRLLEASSSRNLALDPGAGHVREIIRNVQTSGNAERLLVAFPANDGDEVDDNYVMRVWFPRTWSNVSITPEQMMARFTFLAEGNAQDRDGWSIDYGSFGPGSAFHQLSIPLPNLYNSAVPQQEFRVVYRDPGDTNRIFTAIRRVTVNASNKPFLRITRPTVVGSDGRPTELILSDGPGPDAMAYMVQVETDSGVTDAPTLTGIAVGGDPVSETNGNIRLWSYTWNITSPGNYVIEAEASLDGVVTRTSRSASVVLRQVVEPSGFDDRDDDNDGLVNIDESNRKALPTGNAETWSNGDVHIHFATGRSLPASPDSDGDGLPDGLEVGWRTPGTNTVTTTDSNGDGYPNFIGDVDPPLYAAVQNHPAVPGVGSQSQGDDRARQAAGSVTDPLNPDSDGDGLSDGLEDANRNGWTDGDGKPLPLNATPAEYATHRPNLGDWPNNIIESFETWQE
ncbi:MAG: alpha-amylase family glycosyl hydrolase, partial [Chthoniobacterales bacterium]